MECTLRGLARTIEIKPLDQGDDVMFHIKAKKEGEKENAARSKNWLLSNLYIKPADDAFDRIVEPFLKHNANTQYTGQAMILEKAFMVKILTQNLEVKSVIIPPGACTLVAS